MGNIHLVTGYAGYEHVSASDQGAFHTAILGKEQFVLGKGNQFSASVITNNQIRVLDGDIYMQGRYIRLQEDIYVDLAIETDEQGYLRNDLIVARYTKDVTTGVEDCNLVVIKGVHATSNPSDPEYVTGDIINDHVLQNDMPLYRVSLNGLDITELVPLFTVKDATFHDMADDLKTKQTKTDLLTAETALSDGDYFPFYDASASEHKKTLWSNIKTVLADVFAAKTHNHATNDITSGTLPIARGGTGAATAAAALSALGAAAASHEHAATDITSGILAVARGGTGVDNLGALATALGIDGSKAQIEVGSYVGTGQCGEDYANVVTCSFTPKLFMIAGGKYFGETMTTYKSVRNFFTIFSNTGNSTQERWMIFGIDGPDSSNGSFCIGHVSVRFSENAVSWWHATTIQGRHTAKISIESSPTLSADTKGATMYQLNTQGATYNWIAIG